MSQLTQIHYDKPVSHTSQQTVWRIPANSKVFSNSMKVLDINVETDNPACYPILLGVHALVKSVEVKLNSKSVDLWNSKLLLPYMLAQRADNERQFGVMRELYKTGNNVSYNNQTNLFTFVKDLVNDGSSTINLTLFSDLLAKIGIIDDTVELILNWETNKAKMFVPTGVAVGTYTIDAPYLSYETVDMDLKQPEVVYFRQYLTDQFSIPVVTAAADQTATRRTEVLSNAFNGKFVSKIMLVNQPVDVVNGSQDPASVTPNLSDLYAQFGQFMSTPMIKESFNVSVNGRSVFTANSNSNDASKLSMCCDSWGNACLLSLGHFNTKTGIVDNINNVGKLNGFASFGGCELNQRINKQLQISYQRTSDNTGVPTTAYNQALVLSCIGEVQTSLQKGIKVDL
jgi:hypothetical protein